MTQRVLVWLLVERDGAVLLARRKADEPPFAGMWVLPGDRMPEEESAAETLARVGKQELDAEVAMESFVDTLTLREGDADYAVNVFRVAVEGHPRYRESGPYEEAAWAPLNDIRGAGLAMPPALLDALSALAEEGTKS